MSDDVQDGWELVAGHFTINCTQRLPVPGGWIYRVTTLPRGNKEVTVNVVFVPDPEAGRK